jgi:hypothetical protein
MVWNLSVVDHFYIPRNEYLFTTLSNQALTWLSVRSFDRWLWFTMGSFVKRYDRIGPGIAANVVMHAQDYFGFSFSLAQADNGPEYSHYFEDQLHKHGIQTRHSRLHRPNDNAHIERFNRTIQDECLGRCMSYKTPTGVIQAKLTTYLDYYNTKTLRIAA